MDLSFFEIIQALQIPLIVLQCIVAPILIIFVLLQSGKGDDLGSALGGGGGSGSVLGTGGASKLLVRGTAICAVIFMLNSIVLAKIFKEESARSIGGSQTEPLKAAPDAAPANGAPAAPADAAKPAETPAKPTDATSAPAPKK